METLLQDLRYGVRMLAKQRAFTAIAVIALALGIGANTAIFSVVNAVLLKPLPYDHPEQLMIVKETNLPRGLPDMNVSLPDFHVWRESNQVFEQIAAYSTTSYNITGTGEPEQIRGLISSFDLFALLRVNPIHGRAFRPEEEQFGNHQVVILSYGLWARRFGSDANLVGQAITLNGNPFTVIGVMPQGFQFPNAEVALWTPIAFPPEDSNNTRGNHFLTAIARLKPGVTREQAQADIVGITAQLEQQYKENAGVGAGLASLREQTVGDIQTPLIILLGAVGFVLLIACANVANLMLARAASRQKEIAIRTTLGASRGRIVRQLLTESVMLSLAGGVLAVLLALWGVDALISLGPDELPRFSEIRVDARVLGFAFMVSLLTGIIFGLVPALQTSKPDLNESLKEGSRGSTAGVTSHRVRNTLVVTEIAISLVLLICAGLMINSFARLRNVNPGFKPENVLTALIALPDSKYPDSRPDLKSGFFRELIERVSVLPGAQSAAVCSYLPLIGGSNGKLFTRQDRPAPTSIEDIPLIQYFEISPGYFQTMAIPLEKGRFFDERDNGDGPTVAIVNETLARRFFPDEDPLGKVVLTGVPEEMVPPGLLPPGFRFPRLKIVGIVGDVRHNGLAEQVNPEVYVPHAQGGKFETRNVMYLAMRVAGDPLSLSGAVRGAVTSIDKDQPVANIRTMESALADSLARPRFSTLLLGIFAGLALLLAAVGLYGVMSYAVAQRTHEIGIRMALGAESSDVLKMVVRQGLTLTVAGVGIGLAGALILTRLMTSMLYGVSATDPATFALISALLIGVALAACFVPARRATRVDPMVALRYE
ncbi:MAG TPA: ABC transporter permease [Blastocatellia bacterium]|nr:ABC transporter permease [Blastocatellia bacterium]